MIESDCNFSNAASTTVSAQTYDGKSGLLVRALCRCEHCISVVRVMVKKRFR
jgi:hypothetical protein